MARLASGQQARPGRRSPDRDAAESADCPRADGDARPTSRRTSHPGRRSSASRRTSSARSPGWSPATSPGVVSPVGARGVMQVMPETRDFVEQVLVGHAVPNTLDGDIEIGILYLRHLLAPVRRRHRPGTRCLVPGRGGGTGVRPLQDDEAVRGRRARAPVPYVACARGRARPPARRAHGRGAGGARSTRRAARHLQPEGLHPADEALPRRLPLLHLRPAAPPGRAGLHDDRGGARGRPGRRTGRVPRGALHPRATSRSSATARRGRSSPSSASRRRSSTSRTPRARCSRRPRCSRT